MIVQPPCCPLAIEGCICHALLSRKENHEHSYAKQLQITSSIALLKGFLGAALKAAQQVECCLDILF